jgi:hypothetical protein
MVTKMFLAWTSPVATPIDSVSPKIKTSARIFELFTDSSLEGNLIDNRRASTSPQLVDLKRYYGNGLKLGYVFFPKPFRSKSEMQTQPAASIRDDALQVHLQPFA